MQKQKTAKNLALSQPHNSKPLKSAYTKGAAKEQWHTIKAPDTPINPMRLITYEITPVVGSPCPYTSHCP